jgi:hypothetical protein
VSSSASPDAGTGGVRRPRGRHAIQNTVIGVALFVELIALSGHALFGWWNPGPMAATPTPLTYRAPQPASGQQLLLSLAAVAERRAVLTTSRPSAHLPYAYVRRRSWALGGSGRAAVVRPVELESWRRTDGSGRLVSAWLSAQGPRTVTTALSAGPSLPVLATTPSALARQLGLGSGSDGTARPVQAFIDEAALEPIGPRVEAAFLRLLALDPEVVDSGTTVDRAGRAGVAVSVDSDSTGRLIHYTLVLDPATGALLEADQSLASEPGGLHVQEGSVLAYSTYLGAGYTVNTMTRP